MANNNSATSLTLFDELLNDAIRSITTLQAWKWMQTSTTDVTVADQQFYNLPNDLEKLLNITITVGSYLWQPREITSREQWDAINQVTDFESDYPQYYFIFENQVGIFPTPSTADYVITLRFQKRIADLSVADYTTGTVDIVTNDTTAVTVSGTTWSASMAGRWLKITPSDTATASGDGLWYQIASVASTTTLTLSRNYQGTSLTTGAAAAYTIGEMSDIPEAHQQLPLWSALELYFTSVQPEQSRALLYKRKFDDGMKRIKEDEGAATVSPVLSTGDTSSFNPNLFITM